MVLFFAMLLICFSAVSHLILLFHSKPTSFCHFFLFWMLVDFSSILKDGKKKWKKWKKVADLSCKSKFYLYNNSTSSLLRQPKKHLFNAWGSLKYLAKQFKQSIVLLMWLFGVFRKLRYRQNCWVNSFHFLNTENSECILQLSNSATQAFQNGSQQSTLTRLLGGT